MISGAVYREGIARTTDGAVWVSAPASVPATAVGCKGSAVAPAAKFVSLDGEIYVRFV